MSTIGKEDGALWPWRAARTLGPRDVERMENALAGDRELSREEVNETILFNETLDAPSARALEKLFAAIDAEPARKPKTCFDLAGRLAALVSSFSPRTLALAGTAAALAIVLQAGVIANSLVKEQTGQDIELASAGVADGTLAVIRFAPNATAVDITTFLTANRASLVGGPKNGAIYTIRLPETGEAKNNLIQRMQAQSKIVEIISAVQ